MQYMLPLTSVSARFAFAAHAVACIAFVLSLSENSNIPEQALPVRSAEGPCRHQCQERPSEVAALHWHSEMAL